MFVSGGFLTVVNKEWERHSGSSEHEVACWKEFYPSLEIKVTIEDS